MNSVRNTQLYRTIPHEFGHYIHYMKFINLYSHEQWLKLSEVEKEKNANCYAQELIENIEKVQDTFDNLEGKAGKIEMQEIEYTLETCNLYTVAQMQEAERRTETEFGIPLSQLMDNAGRGLANAALDMLSENDNIITVFCGSGNNGGDGYVCALELMQHGKEVAVWSTKSIDELPDNSLVKNAAESYLKAGGIIRAVSHEFTSENIKCNLIVDALLGTGLKKNVSGIYTHLIELINNSPAPVLSCDIPSGVDADTGKIMGIAVNAQRTLMMGLAKPACVQKPGCKCFGEVSICDIGIPQELIAEI